METRKPANTAEAMWKGHPDALAMARTDARKCRNWGRYIQGHSIMLSAYISVARQHPVQLCIFGTIHATFLWLQYKKCSHTQLDVLVQFLLKARARIPGITVGQPSRLKQSEDLGPLFLARRAVALAATDGAKAHQRALVRMTLAETIYATDFNRNEIMSLVETAVAMDKEIRQEPNRLQAKAQFSRVLRKAGELFLKPEMKDHDRARTYLLRALLMAQSIGANDQMRKINALLKTIGG